MGTIRHRIRAFSLVETLVVIALLALFAAMLLPSLSRMRSNVHGLVCASNMKSIAVEFALFADESVGEDRGDSRVFGAKRFWVQDFGDRLYGVDEFWTGDGLTAPVAGRDELMLCPAGPGPLTKRRDVPDIGDLLTPPQNISLGLNMRLQRAEIELLGSVQLLSPVASTQVLSNVVNHPYVPIVLDVDGAAAVARGISPMYTAPPLTENGPYGSGVYWFPSGRHGGKTNTAFVGGHVLSSDDPIGERWDWAYQANWGE